MSWWTHIRGVVEVDVRGRTQAEIRYILETVLDHLPRVTGSEGDMNVYISQEAGFSCSSSLDEFGHPTNNLRDMYGNKSQRNGWLETQSQYMLTIEGDLRDRGFEQTKREFMKWLCRLAKRIRIDAIVMKLWAYDQSIVISDASPYDDMYEWQDGEKRWTDYLMWERDPISYWPLKLANKYFDDKYIEEELKRRADWKENCSGEE